MPGRDTDTAIRIVHDLTQSVWFGGALMGAVSVDAAASTAPDPSSRVEGVDRAWRRWQRVSTPAIVAHLVSGVGLTLANQGRLLAQSGGGRTVALRAGLTGLSLVTELTSRRIGRTLGERALATRTSNDTVVAADDVDGTDEVMVSLQRKLKVAQWANVLATGAMIGVGSRMGEQQRPRELLRGIASRLGIAA